jgi:hypothetical protein
MRWLAFWKQIDRLDCWSWAERCEGTVEDYYFAAGL